MSDTETRTVTVERDFAFPPAKLWRALTQPHLIAEWLMENDFQPKIGHQFKLRGDWGGVLDCEVLVLEPEKTLSYSWDYAPGGGSAVMKTVVVFTLAPTSAGTHLRVEQSGFDPANKQALGGATFGWRKFLGNLEQTLEKLP